MIQLHDSKEIAFLADTSITLDSPFIKNGISAGFSLPSLENEKAEIPNLCFFVFKDFLF